jgi:hypothetical protein
MFTNNSNEKNNEEDFVPMSFALAKDIHGQESNRNMLLLVLLFLPTNFQKELKGNKAPPLQSWNAYPGHSYIFSQRLVL